MDSIDVTLAEIDKLNQKADKLLARTGKLIKTLDSEVQVVKEHLNRIKSMLGIAETNCCICFKNEPTHCMDPCHHVLCYDCANKCLRSSARKCFVCRQQVTSIFKVYSS